MSSKRGLDIFRGRKLIIATMHGKEKVIAPELESAIAVKCEVAAKLDTNQFGTFSGEIKREGTPLDTARKKAWAAMELTGATLAVASEGSFGPHPSYFFVPGNEEFLLLVDAENDLEIAGRYLTTDTNFAHQSIAHTSELEDFCKKTGFPEHGIVLKAQGLQTREKIIKDLSTLEALKTRSEHLLEEGYALQAETDMRAMRNPTRMDAIKQATLKLVEQLLSLCPLCQTPGYSMTKIIDGLPCKLCGSKTRSAKAYVYKCTRCGHTRENPRQDKTREDPMYCDICNP